ncbi:MAG: FAD-dependent oxidoreductase, partial [Clostridia bacterium]|nr:FAD-dependent oxidoreductase [Clostridia bacterium]
MKLQRIGLDRRKIIGIVIICLLILAFLFGYYKWNLAPVPGPMIKGEPGYDVIVVGGEPEGVAAALSAARNGLKTLLLEDDYALGGLMTLGQLNFLDMNHGPQHELLTRGIFAEFYKDLGNAFDVEEAKSYFLKKVKREKNITLLLNTEVIAPLVEGNKIVGVKTQEDDLEKEYFSLRVIDATTDADLAAQTGVPYTIGGEDYGEKGLLMGVTLVFEVAGVNWDRVVQYLKHEDKNPHTGADKVAAWGYGQEAEEYVPQDPLMRFRGPNLARQKNGNVLVNALLIFGVDSLDPASKAAGIARGKKEIPHIVQFMRQKFPGFENAAFVGTAEQLYVRETRHIQGEYRLTITDVLENRDHWDKIGYGSYPVDVQPTSPTNSGNVIGKPDIYAIPFRCLVPLEVENLLVVGRSASYDSLPHGSARVIPVGMVTGEAAGVACAYSIKEAVSFREM